jgi:multiple sugar transport system substrate-binding protein
MKSRLIASLAALALSCFAGLGADPIEIKFMHIHGGTSGEVIKQLCDRYNAMQSKVRVTPVFVDGSYEGVLEKLQALAAVKQLPDVTQCGFQYTNFIIENLPVVPVYKLVGGEKFDFDDFYQPMLALGKYKDGRQYGLPIAVSNPVLYINRDMFRAAGLDPDKDVPKTFDELRAVAKKFTKGDQYGVYFHYSITGNWLFQAMVETFGGQMVAKDGKSVAFDGEAGIRVMRYWNDLVNTDKSMPLLDANQSQKAFMDGKIAMYITTTAGLRSFQLQSKIDFGTAKFPLDGKNPRRIPGGGNNGFVLKSTPEREAAAWDFLKFITGPEGQTAIASGMGYMSTRQSPVKTAELLGDYLKSNPAAWTTYTQIEDMTQWVNFPGKGGTRIFKIVQDNIQAVFSKQKSPEQAMKDAGAEANRLIR